MIGLGTLINTGAILLGGVAGGLTCKLFKQEQQEALMKACGVSVLFIGIAGAMEGMLKISGEALSSGKSMLVVLCVALGTLIGELLGLEQLLERFGEWLKQKSGNSKDVRFVDAFVTASLTVCIGAMAIVGSIRDGIQGDPSILCVKAVLDCILVAVFSSSMGKGAIFSAIPVFLLQGTVTLLSALVAPLMTETATAYLSMIGSMLIFCVGVNLLWGRRIRVANMLPALLLAVAAAYLPISF